MKKFLIIISFLPNILFCQGYCASNFTLDSFNNFEIEFIRGKTNYSIKIFSSKAYLYKENKFREATSDFGFENDTLNFRKLKYSITFFPTLKIYSTFFKNKPILCKLITHNLDDIISLPSNFKACIDEKVVFKMNSWKIKGEFEKTVDFNQRTTIDNTLIAESKFRDEIEQNFITQSQNNFDLDNMSLGKYDADNEFFKIDVSGLNSFNLPVPIKDAPLFKENFDPKKFFNLELALTDNVFEISRINYKNKNIIYSFKRSSNNSNVDDSNDDKLIIEDICVSGDCENGDGTFMWKSGSSYTGYWLDGEMSGFGTYIWSTGEKYVGDWLKGKMHGEGVFTKKNGNITTGIWLNGDHVKN